MEGRGRTDSFENMLRVLLSATEPHNDRGYHSLSSETAPRTSSSFLPRRARMKVIYGLGFASLVLILLPISGLCGHVLSWTLHPRWTQQSKL